jgi:hypothetical protein
LNCLFLNQINSGGILLYGLATGAAINNVLIDGNALWGNYDGILIGGSSNVTTTNNTIIGSYRGFDLSSGGMNNSTIAGNNILAEICINGTGGSGNTINNNICNDGVPRISSRPTNLAVGNVPVNTTSAEHIYVLTGVNLGTNNITVTAPTGYTVSTTTGTGFASSVSVTPSSGIVSQFIYVRFTPTAVQAYNGNITNASTGATTQNVALSGSGTIQTAFGTIDDTKVNKNQLTFNPNASNL